MGTEDATINPIIAKRCRNEMEVFCSKVAHGEARLLACLNINKEKDGFTQGCKSALNKVKVDADKLKQAAKGISSGADSKSLAHDIEQEMEPNKSFMEVRGTFALAATVSLT